MTVSNDAVVQILPISATVLVPAALAILGFLAIVVSGRATSEPPRAWR